MDPSNTIQNVLDFGKVAHSMQLNSRQQIYNGKLIHNIFDSELLIRIDG